MNKDLTKKQEAFAQAVLIESSKSAAYRKAYDCKRMSNEVVHKEASLLASNRKVAVRISELQLRAQERNDITADRVLAEYSYIAFGSIADLYDENNNLKPMKDLSRAERAFIKNIKQSYIVGNEDAEDKILEEMQSHGKIAALRDLAKHLGLFEADNDQLAGSTKTNDELEEDHQRLMAEMRKKKENLENRGGVLEAEIGGNQQ